MQNVEIDYFFRISLLKFGCDGRVVFRLPRVPKKNNEALQKLCFGFR